MKLFSQLLLTLALSFSAQAFAGNAWYWGKVTLIETLNPDGSFLVYLDNASIKNVCLHDRVQFNVSEMGAERTQAAMTMALTAFISGREWGVVLDLPATEEVCHASPTATQGAGIR